MEMTELYKAAEREYYNKAKELGGKIQLIVKGDYNDADYSYSIHEFEPEDFLKYEIYKAYLIFKGAADNNLQLDEISEKYLYGGKRPKAEEIEEPEYVDYITSYDEISEFKPSGDTASGYPVHTIVDVKLNVIIGI